MDNSRQKLIHYGFIEAIYWYDQPKNGITATNFSDTNEIVTKFYEENRGLILDYSRTRQYQASHGTIWEHVGHDLFLTLVEAGEGFWSRQAGEVGEDLTSNAKLYKKDFEWIRGSIK